MSGKHVKRKNRSAYPIAIASLTIAFVFAMIGSAKNGEIPISYVDPFIGTAANGHTFPGAAYPFGLVQPSPDTGGTHGLFLMADWKWCAGYNYDDKTILGFSHTHRSGMGVGDWGDILFMPTTGKLRIGPGEEDDPDKGYRSRFRHETEIARPGYYKVALDDYGVVVEIAAAKRSAFHRYTFPKSDSSHILIDLKHGLGDVPLKCRVKIIGNDTISGARTSTGEVLRQNVYFCARYSKPFDSYGVWNNSSIKLHHSIERGRKIGAFVNYRTGDGEVVLVKVGISYTSENEACANLDADMPDWDFDKVAYNTSEVWSKELGKIKVRASAANPSDETEKRIEVFYSALYHSLMFPSVFNDADGSYAPIGNKPGEAKLADGFEYYSDYSIWDTFRAQMPLLMTIEPDRANDMIATMIRQYQDSGWLPSPQNFGNYHSEGMIGDHAACIILDARLKGVTNFDLDAAYAGIRKNAVADAVNIIPMTGGGKGRYRIEDFMKRGYIPANKAFAPSNPLFIASYIFNQAVSRTLEYAYDDYCVAQLAKETGHADDYVYFLKRSQNYRNVFDSKTGFMRGRKADGSWMNEKDFDPAAYYAYYTEGNSWQWTWSVFHDVSGLIALMGGRDAFNEKLDRFFSIGPKADAYKFFSVHMSGMIGQYAHGNEPSHHIAYLYDFSGQPWKTQAMTRRIMDEFYRATPDGLPGNDDMGQLSAWYVFSAIGIYPFFTGFYTIGSPTFEHVEIEMKDGKILVIEAENASSKNKYIQSATLNGVPLDRPWFSHAEIANGATLHFVMGPEPNYKWGSDPQDAPPHLDELMIFH